MCRGAKLISVRNIVGLVGLRSRARVHVCVQRCVCIYVCVWRCVCRSVCLYTIRASSLFLFLFFVVVFLWSICCLFRQHRAPEAVYRRLTTLSNRSLRGHNELTARPGSDLMISLQAAMAPFETLLKHSPAFETFQRHERPVRCEQRRGESEKVTNTDRPRLSDVDGYVTPPSQFPCRRSQRKV